MSNATEDVPVENTEQPTEDTTAEAAATETKVVGTVSEEAKTALESQLANRESHDEVVKRNIKRASHVADSLRGPMLQLQHQMTTNQVDRALRTRPNRKSLTSQGILHHGNISSRLQQNARRLQRAKHRDKVNHLLEKQPNLSELHKSNVHRGTKVASKLQAAQEMLRHSLAKSNLYHRLNHRPSLQELIEKGVYVPPPPESEEDARWEEEEEDWEDEKEVDYAFGDQAAAEAYAHQQAQEQQYYDQQYATQMGYQRRSKNFHLTRILLKYVNSWGESGDLSLAQKGFLKDLIVDQDQVILAVAEAFDAENDINDFKDSLIRLTARAQ